MGRTTRANWTAALGLFAWAACGDGSDDMSGKSPPAAMPGAPAAGAPGSGMAPGSATQPPSTNNPVTMGTAGSGSQPPGTTPGNMPGTTPPSTPGGTMPPATMGGAGRGPVTPPPGGPMTPFMGPVDGDPAKPMVSVMGVPCGPANVSFAGVPAQNMVKITNRDVFVSYPCAHEGAAVTFYLAIHGTLNEGQKIPFTLTNFPVHKNVDSDNFIVVAPQAIGTQWGNGDNDQDLPHLYDVINWVYDTFGEKFSIRGMWASGGSWGSAYLYTFACDPMLEKRLTGIRMIVGRGCPPCSTRLSCIVGEQELEEGMGMMLTDMQKEMKISATSLQRYADMHGCDARSGPTNLGPVRAWTWANCDGGYQHSYYLGPGQHADRWDDPTYVAHMVKEMKAADR